LRQGKLSENDILKGGKIKIRNSKEFDVALEEIEKTSQSFSSNHIE